MPKLHLVSFNLCPFVQRSVITLHEKGVGFDITYIDLSAKPEWFLRISPFGKVPVLTVDDETTIFESAVINEYLDETTGHRLHPEDPLRRAHNRSWIEFGSALAVDSYRLMVASDEAAAHKAAGQCREKLDRFAEQLGDGPYFNGPDFSLVDAAVAPVLQRITWCENIAPALAIFEASPKVKVWRDALLARPSVEKSLVAGVDEIFIEYLQGRGSPTRKAESTWLGRAAS